MAISRLADLVSRTKKPVRDVAFTRNEFGIVAHLPGEPTQEDDVLFKLRVQYVPSAEIRQTHQDSMVRRAVADQKRKGKTLQADPQKAQLLVCQRAIVGWDMTVAGARALETVLDFGEAKGTDPIPFNPENVGVMAQHSTLGDVTEALLADYAFFFPDEKEQEGNSSSGPATSTATPGPAAPALTVTGPSTKPSEE